MFTTIFSACRNKGYYDKLNIPGNGATISEALIKSVKKALNVSISFAGLKECAV